VSGQQHNAVAPICASNDVAAYGLPCRNTSADTPRQDRPSGAEADRSGV